MAVTLSAAIRSSAAIKPPSYVLVLTQPTIYDFIRYEIHARRIFIFTASKKEIIQGKKKTSYNK